MKNSRATSALVPARTSNCTHEHFIKKGFFKRLCDGRRVQKFLCLGCGTWFSTQTTSDTYRLRRMRLAKRTRDLLCSGVARRRVAFLLKISRRTVERILSLLAARSAAAHEAWLKRHANWRNIQFDEMETHEHTKLKPLSLPLVVGADRSILAFGIASMGYRGTTAKLAYEKYGPRRDDRRIVMESMLTRIAAHLPKDVRILTDENPRYPGHVKRCFPAAVHTSVKGGRGCIAGFGELREKRFDPMFALNHTAAMVRYQIAALKRRTWTSTKKPENLLKLLMIVTHFHNTVWLPNQNKKSAKG